MSSFKNILGEVTGGEQFEELDLSVDEDLSIAVMNLISLEEHLFFTGAKTETSRYYELLNTVRDMRQSLMEKLLVEYEGEEWCIAKHLLGATMRLLEVGEKYQASADEAAAAEYFSRAYDLYSLFWGIKLDEIQATELETEVAEEPEAEDVTGRLNNLVRDIVDCCK